MSENNDDLRDWRNGMFMGIPIRQWPADLYYWEKFFYHNKIKTMIELGTGSGGLSLFFLLLSKKYNFNFHTFDNKMPDAIMEPLAILLDFASHFRLGDIFEDKKNHIIELFEITEAPHLLYCDNGWKPKEVETFAPYLSENDFLAVHDWGTEIYEKDIPYDLLKDYSGDINSLTRWFIRRGSENSA